MSLWEPWSLFCRSRKGNLTRSNLLTYTSFYNITVWTLTDRHTQDYDVAYWLNWCFKSCNLIPDIVLKLNSLRNMTVLENAPNSNTVEKQVSWNSLTFICHVVRKLCLFILCQFLYCPISEILQITNVYHGSIVIVMGMSEWSREELKVTYQKDR